MQSTPPRSNSNSSMCSGDALSTRFYFRYAARRKSRINKKFYNFNEEKNSDICLEYYKKHRMTAEDARKIKRLTGINRGIVIKV